METTTQFDINTVGGKTGNPYNGVFSIKTLLSRKDEFAADAMRRRLLGENPRDALPDLQLEAYMLAQLSVRVIDAPDWWTQSGNGLELADSNVIVAIYEATMIKIEEKQKAVQEQAKAALEQLAKGSNKKK